VRVRIPTPLRSYTGEQASVEVEVPIDRQGEDPTVAHVLEALDDAHPGIRFRVVDEQHRLRRHMKVFVNEEAVRDLRTPVGPDDEVTIMQALSGG